MIRIDVRSANGETIASSPAHPDFDPLLSGIDKKYFPILGHLDPYGDTVLNRLQAESLLTEIESATIEGGLIPTEFAQTLIDLCNECINRPHRFMWFIGE